MPKIGKQLRKTSYPPIEDNSNNPVPSQDEVEVAIPHQEGEDNLEGIHVQKDVEPSLTRGLGPTSEKNGVEGRAVNRSQRTTRPPVWFGDFVVGGNLDQSFTGSQQSNKQLKVVSMVQQQLDQQPLELTEMWHDNDEERKEKRLPGERLDISWVSTSPKRLLQTDFAMLPLKKSSVE